jgi:hypothetical protein
MCRAKAQGAPQQSGSSGLNGRLNAGLTGGRFLGGSRVGLRDGFENPTRVNTGGVRGEWQRYMECVKG